MRDPFHERLAGKFRQLFVAVDAEQLLHHAALQCIAARPVRDRRHFAAELACAIRVSEHFLAQPEAFLVRLDRARNTRAGKSSWNSWSSRGV
jgi:hypothetical protein